MSKRSKERKLRKDQGKQQFQVQRFAENARRKREYAAATGDLSVFAPTVAAHYHLLFNAVPNQQEGFETPTLAYKAMGAIMDNFKEGDDYQVYEEGHVLLTNVRLKDRTGRHQVFMQVGECYGRCPNIRKLAEHSFQEGQLGKPTPTY